MQASIEVARPDDESQDIALWRSCNLVTQPNDPGMDFRFALPVRHVLRSGFRGCHRTGLRKRQGRPWRQPGLALLLGRGTGGGQGIGRAVGEAGAHWLRAPCARGADHASPPNHGAPFYAHIGHEGMSRVPMGKWRLRAALIWQRRQQHACWSSLSTAHAPTPRTNRNRTATDIRAGAPLNAMATTAHVTSVMSARRIGSGLVARRA
ncbi:hypothetical protein ATCC53582_02157 [Novacetimonas hansenii]|nr:hypothetical protein ATCC53582_02157 [Novacetimonas hansenii]